MNGASQGKKLKFALLCNGPMLQQWQRESLKLILEEGYASIELIIMPIAKSPAKLSWAKKIRHYTWNKLLFKKYYQYFFRPPLLQAVAFDDFLINVPVVRCNTIRKGKYSEYFSESDIRLIQSYAPDFMLKFGFGIVRGDILNCTPYGIWSFHHGDEQKFRGVPPAFWEIVKNEKVTASMLQRLTEKLDGGLILRKGYFPTITHSWKASLEQAIRLSLSWPADVCREIAELNSFPASEVDVNTTAPIYRMPGNLTLLHFLIRSLVNRIRFHLHEIFRAEKWQTGLIKMQASEILASATKQIDSASVNWIEAKEKHRYFADGFAVKEKDQLLLFFEDYSYCQRKAHISALYFNENEKSVMDVRMALKEPWHLSYPYLFNYENKIYCIPESLEHGSVELYELDVLTGKLEHVRTLVAGLSAADPSLVFHCQRWYLFFTPAHATNIVLNLWHADTLEGPFVPHILSPVKADIRNARPAGAFFEMDKKLYRPAQDCSQTYGGRVVINQIKALTATEFVETPVAAVEPPVGFSGLHTLSFSGDYLYFDAKKFVFISSSAKYQLKKRLRMAKPAKAVHLP